MYFLWLKGLDELELRDKEIELMSDSKQIRKASGKKQNPRTIMLSGKQNQSTTKVCVSLGSNHTLLSFPPTTYSKYF